ncbi:MAG: Coenzyme F420 hydrogenase/dehydrogenase, beta subunit C-terminal domain [Myxococcales bacterium]|jgi:coenzyme F420-reducing hydrogenase beta subunit|nr:Coenzyme F420 hydrogenase/dehydrogenase, beta subunit C-terminal domain [Myxococcales bacterium]
MITPFDDRADCCGCTACVHACPRDALAMRPDAEGFAYPVTDASRCIDCGLCRRICAFQNDRSFRSNGPMGDLPRVLAVKHRNVAIRSQSQSGGLFTLLSDPVLAAGGVVYGAGFREDFSVAHQRATTREARDELRGSKYVQSDLGRIFRDVRCDLEAGRLVLFSGTPCQVAALDRALTVAKVDRSHLLLCDLVCHGTPSPRLWRDYLTWMARREGSAIVRACFRDSQRFGWHTGLGTLAFANGHTAVTDLFAQFFLKDLVLRPSCHVCPYATLTRVSDITMGDFWGIERAHPDFGDNIGVSLALIHSDKGRQAIEAASARMECVESCAEKAMQPNLRAPSKPSPRREQFWSDYERRGFDFVLMKYASIELKKQKMKRTLKELLLKTGLWTALHSIRKKSRSK